MNSEIYDIKKYETFNTNKNKQSVESFHKKRIAFIIRKDDVLYLKNSALSHKQWCEQLGINEEEFNSLTRGYFLGETIVFYKGNFGFDSHVMEDAKKFAPKIKQELNINSAKVYVGLIPGDIGTVFPPEKYLFDL